MLLDPLAAIDACYAPVEDDRAWARGLLASLAPAGGEAVLHALRFERTRCDRDELTLLASSASSAPFDALVGDQGARATIVEALFRASQPVVGFLSHQLATGRRVTGNAVQTLLRSIAAADLLVVRGHDGDRVTLAIVAPVTSATRVSSRMVCLLRRLNEHLSSALRLRSCVEGGAERAPDARPPSLFEAVEQLARQSGRPAAPGEATALWEAFVSGRWTVVALAGHSGQHALLLRPGGRHDPRALTVREREVVACVARGLSNKETGYLLRIGPTTVATHLAVAGRKLCAPTRQALIALFARGESAPSP
jgi:DNA-binding CsgD family transcriptional regulator